MFRSSFQLHDQKEQIRVLDEAFLQEKREKKQLKQVIEDLNTQAKELNQEIERQINKNLQIGNDLRDLQQRNAQAYQLKNQAESELTRVKLLITQLTPRPTFNNDSVIKSELETDRPHCVQGVSRFC